MRHDSLARRLAQPCATLLLVAFTAGTCTVAAAQHAGAQPDAHSGAHSGAHAGAHAGAHSAPPTAATPASAKAEGEVRRVDAANGRIQLRHGPIPNLDMPPMTMVFRVREASLLDGLKEGDRILFSAERIDGAYTVTQIERKP